MSKHQSAESAADARSDVSYYDVLNVPSTATAKEIKTAYTTLARDFHPDKQRDADARSLADAQFITIKTAYKTLSDPSLRAAYDEFGHEGLQLLNENPSALSELTLYAKKPKALRKLLEDQVKYQRYKRLDENLKTSGSLDLTSSLIPVFKGQTRFPEMQSISMNQHVECPLTRTSTLSFGGYLVSRYGLGAGAAQLSLSKQVKSTTLMATADIGHHQKFSFVTSRMLGKGSMANAKLVLSNGQSPGLQIGTSRFLGDNWTSQCSLGFGAGQLASLYLSAEKSYPQDGMSVTTDINLDPQNTFLRMTCHKIFNKLHSGRARLKYNTHGPEIVLTSARVLSRFTKLSIGLRINLHTGILWIIKVKRGKMNFQLPLAVSMLVNPLTMLFSISGPMLLDELICGALRLGLGNEDAKKEEMREDEFLKVQEKGKNDAKAQQQLMKRAAGKKRTAEAEKSGLVIMQAKYGYGVASLDQSEDEDGLDVTVPIQFFVQDSALRLPAGSKNSILGFYHIGAEGGGRKARKNRFSLFALDDDDDDEEMKSDLSHAIKTHQELSCYIRYSHQGYVFEVTFSDDDEIILPSDTATIMGEVGSIS